MVLLKVEVGMTVEPAPGNTRMALAVESPSRGRGHAVPWAWFLVISTLGRQGFEINSEIIKRTSDTLSGREG